jgi:hypothetical protein
VGCSRKQSYVIAWHSKYADENFHCIRKDAKFDGKDNDASIYISKASFSLQYPVPSREKCSQKSNTGWPMATNVGWSNGNCRTVISLVDFDRRLKENEENEENEENACPRSGLFPDRQ